MSRVFALIFMLHFISCGTKETLPADTSKITVFSEKKFVEHFLDNCEPTELSELELNQIEFIFDQICKEHEQLKSRSDYHRQYIPGISTEGHKLIWINSFCYDEYIYADWKKGIITVKEGAPCYFYVTIDLTSDEWFGLELENVHSIHQ